MLEMFERNFFFYHYFIDNLYWANTVDMCWHVLACVGMRVYVAKYKHDMHERARFSKVHVTSAALAL